jgi:hypothetical protein
MRVQCSIIKDKQLVILLFQNEPESDDPAQVQPGFLVPSLEVPREAVAQKSLSSSAKDES